jgi:hypothetical protein
MHSNVSRRTPLNLYRLFTPTLIGILFLFLPAEVTSSTGLPNSTRTIVTGTVTDAHTGEPLMAATVQIEGTYRGTITNADGQYSLRVDTFPTVIQVRYIGYQSVRIPLESDPTNHLNIPLEPAPFNLNEVVVTGEDPALGIMREVIRRKAIWRDQLNTYEAEAYTRQRLENETGIVSITESLSAAFWDKRRGTREVILYKDQTSNLDPTQNFASATNLPNFYDDNIPISGFTMVGVTHPQALDFYHFKLEGYRQLDDKTVYDILVTPRRRLQPTFEGHIAVLGEDYALIEVDLRPGESVMFPPPIQEFGLWYRQQFSNFGGAFWLPVDVRIEGTIRIGFPGLQFPTIQFNQLSRITNYQVNIELPAHLYETQRRIVSDTVMVQTRGFTSLTDRDLRVPLDDRETQAYAELDSTKTLDKAFEPTGPLSRFVNNRDENEDSGNDSRFGKYFNGITPDLAYNRAEEARLGLRYRIPLPDNLRLQLNINAAYRTGPADAAWGTSLRYRRNTLRPIRPGESGSGRSVRNRRGFWYLETGFSSDNRTRFQETSQPQLLTSAATLLGAPDYFDYYHSEVMHFEAARRVRRDGVTYGLRLQQEVLASVPQTTNYSIPGGIRQRQNPLVESGTDRTIGGFLHWGDDPTPFGVTGNKSVRMSISHASTLTGSDFDYTRLAIQADYRLETFFKRRFLPNTLDVRLTAGTTLGQLPMHRWHGIDSAMPGFTAFGGLRTRRSQPFEGTQAAAIFWEHNFRTIPFEMLNLNRLVKKSTGIIIHGAHAWSNVDFRTQQSTGYLPRVTGNSGHHEIGLSLNNLFGVMRLDSGFRLDAPGGFFGVSVARFF